MEINTLLFLNKNSGEKIKFYAKAIGLEDGSFTYLIKKMEEKEYVEIKKD